MKKIIIIILVLTSFNLYIFSQENDIDSVETSEIEGVVLFPSHRLESHIKMSLHAMQMLIQLKIHPLLNLTKDQLSSFSEIIDTIKTLHNVTRIDSINLTLKSGISWDLRNGPPPSPKNFYFKILAKKGKRDQAVIERLKYLEFCYDLDVKNKQLFEVIEKFNTYYVIIIEGVEYIRMEYEIKFNKEGKMKISRKEIMINSF